MARKKKEETAKATEEVVKEIVEEIRKQELPEGFKTEKNTEEDNKQQTIPVQESPAEIPVQKPELPKEAINISGGVKQYTQPEDLFIVLAT